MKLKELATLFWSRDKGFARIEFNAIKDLYDRIVKREKMIFGYVKWTNRRDIFLLVPLPWISQIYVICEIGYLNMPPDGAYICAEGVWKRKITNLEKMKIRDVFVIEKYSIEKDVFITQTKPSINFDEFTGRVFESWSNLNKELIFSTSLDLISTPPILNRIGGISTAIFSAKRKSSLTASLVTHLRKIAVPLIHSKKRIKVDDFEIKLTYPVKLKTVKGEPDSKTQKIIKREITKDEEISVVIGSKRTSGEIISMAQKDVTFKFSDFPVLMDPSAERQKKKSVYFDPEVIEFMITAHMITPSIDSNDILRAASYIQKDLLRLIESFNIVNEAPILLRLLNHDYFGRPLSAIRIARSIARAYLFTKVTFDDIIRVYRETYRPIFENWFNEFIQEIEDVTRIGARVSLLDNIQRRVLRFISRRATGVTLKEIIQFFSDIPATNIENIIIPSLMESGFIYRDPSGRYKAV